LDVVLVPLGGVASVTALVMVGVGSRYETKKMNGISHFLEHMVFKGTKKWPTARDLSTEVDGIGAEFNAFTGKEYTGFYVKSAASYLDLSLDVLTDMMYASKLRSGDIEREKGVIVEEINMYNDLPQRKVEELFEQAMYGDVGLGRRIDGTKGTVTKFNRDDFVKHLETWYTLDNTCLVLAGDATVLGKEEKVMDRVRELFAKGEWLDEGGADKSMIFENHGEVQTVVHTKESDQAHLVMGFPGYALGHADRYALSVLGILLGGNMSSRLFTEVREKRGLAYYARVDVDRYLDTGAMAAAEGVDISRVDEAVAVTMEVFSDVDQDKKKGVTEEEVKRAQEYLAGSLLLSMESTRNTAQYWGQRVVLGDEVIGPEEVLAKIRAVTREDVVRVAKDVVRPEKMVFALVGPFDDKGKFDRLLRFEAD